MNEKLLGLACAMRIKNEGDDLIYEFRVNEDALDAKANDMGLYSRALFTESLFVSIFSWFKDESGHDVTYEVIHRELSARLFNAYFHASRKALRLGLENASNE